MTTKILIQTPQTNECFDYFVHEEHEADFCSFLKNHGNKQQIGYTEPHAGIEWFSFVLTTNDIETIKKTCWYANTKWGNPDLDDQLQKGAKIEVFIAEYIPSKDGE